MKVLAEAVVTIEPSGIDTSRHFFDAFGNMETEVSARYVVRLCQELGGWVQFTRDQIEDFYTREGPGDGFWFNRLIPDGYIVEVSDGCYQVTEEFVFRCRIASPKQ